MTTSNTFNYNYSTFNPVAQQKKSRRVAGLLLTVFVAGLHAALAWYLLNAPATEPKKSLVIMEVAMLKPEPVLKQAPKEPAPAPPPAAKKEPIKPKAVVKPPKPVNKPVVVKKPAPVVKPQPTEIKEAIPQPTFVPTPMPASAPAAASSTASTIATTSKTTGHGSGDSGAVVSGVVALLRVPPKYPTRAASRHIEGWVTVEFTVQTDGSVDDAVVVVQNV